MIARVLNPATVATLSVMISISLGVFLSWRTLSTVTAQVVISPKVAKVNELKAKGWDFWTIEIDNLANELKEERERLKKQAEALDLRAARLANEEKEFAKLRADVESLRKQIADKVVEIGADEAKNIRSLAATYANLTPKAAVAIFKEMDDTTAVKILSLMKPDVVGPIFEEMSRLSGPDAPLAKRAAMLSEKLRLMKAAKSAS